MVFESDKSTIANTIFSAYIAKLDISQRINLLVAANEFSSAVEELIKINRYKEAVILSNLWLSKQQTASLLRDWSDFLEKTGNYEQAARVSALLNDRTNCLALLQKRKSSHRATRTITTDSTLAFLTGFALEREFEKSKFLEVLATIIDNASADKTLQKLVQLFENLNLALPINLDILLSFFNRLCPTTSNFKPNNTTIVLEILKDTTFPDSSDFLKKVQQTKLDIIQSL